MENKPLTKNFIFVIKNNALTKWDPRTSFQKSFSANPVMYLYYMARDILCKNDSEGSKIAYKTTKEGNKESTWRGRDIKRWYIKYNYINKM